MQVDAKAGILVFLAIFLHKIPEGLTIASLILATGKGLKQVLIATSIVGCATLFGVLLAGNLGISLKYALPVATGVAFYVAASDLIPELNHQGGKRPLLSLFLLVGVALFFALHYLLHIALEH
jgi:zinc transporter ZupT